MRHLLVRALPIGEGVYVVLRDDTDRVERDEALEQSRRLQKAVEERGVLFRELHHRVKNNLQLVSSLLSLRMRGLEDGEARAALEDSRERVRTIALVHEQLYREEGVQENLELGPYLRKLVGQIGHLMPHRELELELTLQGTRVSLDAAVACGLVAHELLSNAVEHGQGTHPIQVRGGETSDTGVFFEVRDGGETVPREGAGLGLTIVRSMAAQLGGEVHFTPGGARFTFPVESA